MKRVSGLVAVMFVLVACLATPSGRAQSSDPAAALRRYIKQKPPLGDYVPCMFDSDQEYELRTRESPTEVLDATAAQNVVKVATSASKPPVSEPNGVGARISLSPEQQAQNQQLTSEYKAFTDSLKPELFQGLALSDAIEKVAALATAANVPAQNVSDIKTKMNSQISASKYVRPDDVSCSFSILPWNETNYVFGRMVANNYVAIEVNIRNLNKDDEFLLHDIQVAVDTGLDSDSFGRFEAGRDKLIVRDIAQRGESDDIRNLVMNALGIAGTVAGGASGALTSGVGASDKAATYLSTAVSIFEGPVMSGLGKMFPDHTLDNVKNVSDLAFSASSTLKTVIPTQGAAPMVTFIAKKPLEELPFAWCGSKAHPTKPERICSVSGTVADTDWTSFNKQKNYKDWAPAALNILKHRIYVVVAGVHIIEVSKDAAADNISCPTVADGTIDLSATDDKQNISCTIAGANMENAKSAELKQGSTSISATLAPATDGNSATLGFKAADFAGTSGTYEIFSKGSTGKDSDLKKSLQFAIRVPVIDNVSYNPSSLVASVGAADATGPKGVTELTATIRGSNLDRLGEVDLVYKQSGLTPTKGSLTDPAKTLAKTGVVTYTFAINEVESNLKGQKAGTGLATIQYDTLDDPKTKVSVPAKSDSGLAVTTK